MKVKMVIFADTHGLHRSIQIPDGDILVFAGDLCAYGNLAELEEFNSFLGQLPHRVKVLVAGNHDVCLEKDPPESIRRLTNAIYLQDQSITLLGIKFYGSPWQPEFQNWAFNLPPGEALREKWDSIPNDIDVLITHGPPYGYGDLTQEGIHAGDAELLRAIQRIQPQWHIFGHIHEGYGAYEAGRTRLINASICDGLYRPVHSAVVEEFSPRASGPPSTGVVLTV